MFAPNALRQAARGYILPVAALLLVAVAIIAFAYPAHRDAQAKQRLAELSQTIATATAELEKVRAAKGAFPNAFFASGAQLMHAEPLLQYIAANDNQAYTVTGENASHRVWVGVNSVGVRCQCANCTGPTIFNQTTTACPAGTQAF